MTLRRTKSRTSAVSSPHDVYSITCSCGEFLSGERESQPLILECPNCSEKLYVLPKDVYPRPKVLVPETESPRHRQEAADALELAVESVEDEGQRLAEPRDDTPPRVWIDQPRGKQVSKRILQVSGLVLLLLLATWWGISRRARRTDAQAAFFAQSEDAWQFVSEENWEQAQAAAEAAVDAADYLGRNDPASAEIRDLSAELSILSELSSQSLIEILLESQEEGVDLPKWKSLFAARHGGNWLLLEGAIVRETHDDVSHYHFDYPIRLEGLDVDLVWDGPVPLFEKLAWDSDRYEAFIAVRMQEIRFEEESGSSWSIVLSPDDVRFWTTPVLLTQALGVDLDSVEAQPLRKLVESQIPADRSRHDEAEPEPDKSTQPDPSAEISAGGQP